MVLIRSDRAAAVLLLLAALLGLLVANSPLDGVAGWMHETRLAIPFTPIDLSVEHWISDGLLAVFFFVAAIELRHELTVGQLNTPRHAVRPALAALGGVVVPAAIYLAITAGSDDVVGWPIPTATDIAFALGILAVFGRGLPSRLRAFMLALAILDDIVAIGVIAVVFTDDARLVPLLLAAGAVAAWAVLGRRLGTRASWARRAIVPALVVLATATWGLVLTGGVHATIAGVVLGLTMAPGPADRTRHVLEPVTNGVVLPLFAFTAALVPVPSIGLGELSRGFWGIAIALPVGKIIGIAFGGLVASAIGPKDDGPRIDVATLLTAGALGGIGFTVSLLMNELAFEQRPEVADQGTLAVLLGSGISMVVAAVLVSRLAAAHRRRSGSAG